MNDVFERYILMHKNTEVLDITIDKLTGSILYIDDVIDDLHLPVGVQIKKGMVDRNALNEWWIGRSIPASRSGLQHMLETLQITAPQKLLEKCLGLSLSDQYWICPKQRPIKWKDINFFENDFSSDVGELLFGGNIVNETPDLMSPNNTSDGWLRKKWVLKNGKRCLIKGGSGAIQQEPYNEVIASKIMERLGINHVKYNLQIIDGMPYSVCEDFISQDTEFISAWYLLHTQPKQNHISLYQHYLNCCFDLNIPDIKLAISQQIVLDYLIVNEDRHQGNFGVIRNADTLAYICVAPIFDSGSSLWFETPTTQIRGNAKTGCKPFKTNHEEQLRLIDNFKWLDTARLNGLGEIAKEVFVNSEFVDEKRANAIALALENRSEKLLEYVQSHDKAVDNIVKDVTENIAYSGKETVKQKENKER